MYDVRQRRQRLLWTAHTLSPRALAMHEKSRRLISAAADGDLKVWYLGGGGGGGGEDDEDYAPPLLGHVARAHEPHTMLHPLPGTTLGRTYGVNQLVLDGERLLTAGADGKLNVFHLVGP